MTQHTPEIHHSDQGVQYAATAYTARLRAAGVHISMAEVGAAWQNGYAERLMRTIKSDHFDLSGSDLSGAEFSFSTLPAVNLENTDLTGTYFTQADMTCVNLRRANLSEANLSGAILEGASLDNEVREYIMRDGKWTPTKYGQITNLKDAKVTQEQLNQTSTLEGAIMPGGTKHA